MRPVASTYDDSSTRHRRGGIGRSRRAGGVICCSSVGARDVFVMEGASTPNHRIREGSMTSFSLRRLSGNLLKGRSRVLVLVLGFMVLAVYAALPAFAVHDETFQLDG